MKRLKIIFILIIAITVCAVFTPTAFADEISPDFAGMFDDNGAVMLLIDPQTGSIEYANKAATAFYGYTKAQLLSMKISDVNTLSLENTDREMLAAVQEERNYFVFKHRLASGEIRTVEVYLT